MEVFLSLNDQFQDGKVLMQKPSHGMSETDFDSINIGIIGNGNSVSYAPGAPARGYGESIDVGLTHDQTRLNPGGNSIISKSNVSRK